MILGGKHVASNNSEVIEVYNLATGELVDTVPSATSQDVERALEIACEGKDIWSAVPFEKRYEILCQAADMLLDAKDSLAVTLVKETGKIFSDALGEVNTAVAIFRGYAEKMRHTYEQVLPHDTDLVIVRHDPLGVVACLVPFNFPIELYAHKVVSA